MAFPLPRTHENASTKPPPSDKRYRICRTYVAHGAIACRMAQFKTAPHLLSPTRRDLSKWLVASGPARRRGGSGLFPCGNQVDFSSPRKLCIRATWRLNFDEPRPATFQGSVNVRL